jgi:hypothetical protein
MMPVVFAGKKVQPWQVEVGQEGRKVPSAPLDPSGETALIRAQRSTEEAKPCLK